MSAWGRTIGRVALLAFILSASAPTCSIAATPDMAGRKDQTPPASAETDWLTQHAIAKFGKLSECEGLVLSGISRGLIAHCGPHDPNELNPAKGESWGPQRQLRASLIRWLLVDPEASKRIEPQGILIEGARIDSELLLQALTIPFPVILDSCFIPEGIALTGAHIGFLALQNVRSGSVDAPSLNSSSSFLLEGGRIEGFLRLSGAQINGTLNLKGASIANAGMKGIDGTVIANSIRVGGSVYFQDGFATDGIVSMNEAKIASDFAFQDSRFIGSAPTGLVMERANIQGSFWWIGNKLSPSTVLDLDSTTAAALRDDVGSWPAPGKLYLDGFAYNRIDCFDRDKGCSADAGRRLEWIRRQAYDTYHPQPYRQLAKVLEDRGDQAGASRVLIAAQDDARVKGRLSWPFWIWSWILKLTVGYGYAPQRALYWAALLVVLGGFLVKLGHQAGVMKPVALDRTMTAMVYSLDVFLPIVDLRLQHDWWPDPSAKGQCNLFGHRFTFYGSALRVYLWFHIVAGWLLTTLFIAGLSGLIHKT